MIVYAALIIFFCFFYTAIQYNPKETAENLKGRRVHPRLSSGRPTAKYIEKITTRLTLIGRFTSRSVRLIPEFLISAWNVQFYFGGTSLLIVVVVTMDFMTQVQAYMMSQQYDSLLKGQSEGGLKVYRRMAKEDTIQMQGDSRNVAERNISGEVGKRARCPRAHLRQDAHELHKDIAG